MGKKDSKKGGRDKVTNITLSQDWFVIGLHRWLA